MNSGKTLAFDHFSVDLGAGATSLGLFGADSGVLNLMDLGLRSNVARFDLHNAINCLHYFDKLATVVVGFESGLMKSYRFKMSESAKWQVKSKSDLIQHFSLPSKLFIEGRNFTEKIEHNDHELVGLQTLKIFSSAVTHMVADEAQNTIVFRSADHELFFMKTRTSKSKGLEVVPLFLLQLSTQIRDFRFHAGGRRLMFSLSTGLVLSVQVPGESEIDNRRNFLIELKDPRLDTRVARMTMMEFQKPQLDENDLFYVLNGSTGEENIEWDPEAISVILEVENKASLGELGRLIRAQIEECQQIEEQVKEESSKKSEKDMEDPSGSEVPPEPEPAVPIESVKIGDQVDFGELEKKDLVLVGSEGNFLGYLYVLEIHKYTENSPKEPAQVVEVKSPRRKTGPNRKKESQVVRPVMAFKIKDLKLSLIKSTQEDTQIILGYENGSVEIRKWPRLDVSLVRGCGHDQQTGSILHTSFFNSYNSFLTIGADCAISFYNSSKFQKQEKTLEFDNLVEKEIMDTDEINHIRDIIHEGKQQIVERIPNFSVIERVFMESRKFSQINPKITLGYSLQEEKIQAVEDKRHKEEEVKRKTILSRVGDLKHQFKLLCQKNRNLPEVYQLPPEKLIFDEGFKTALYQRKQQLLEESGKKLEFEFHLDFVKTTKLKRYFLDELHGLSFAVVGFTSPGLEVRSFKIKRATEYMKLKFAQAEKIQGKDLIEYNRVVGRDQFKLHSFFCALGELDSLISECVLDSLSDQLDHAQRDFPNDRRSLKMYLRQFRKEINRDQELQKRLQELAEKNDSQKLLTKGEAQTSWEEYINELRARVRPSKREDYYEGIRKRVRQECTAMSIEQLRRFQQATKKKVDSLRGKGSEGRGRNKSLESEANLTQAERPEGDYKLKLKMDFKLDDELKISLESQEARIIRLELLMLRLKILFNQNLRNLRKRKRDVVMKSQRERDRVERLMAGAVTDIRAQVGEWNLPQLGLDESREYPHKLWVRRESTATEEPVEDRPSNVIRVPKRDKRAAELAGLKRRSHKQRKSVFLLKEKLLVEEVRLEKGKIENEIQSEILDIEQRLKQLKEEKALLENYFRQGESRVVGLFQEMLEIEIFERKDLELQKEYFEKRKNYMIWENEQSSINKSIANKKKLEGELNQQLRETYDKMREKIFPEDEEKCEIIYEMFKEKRDKEAEQNQEGESVTDTLSDIEDQERRDLFSILEQSEEALDLAQKRYDSESRLAKLIEEKKNLLLDRGKIEKKINGSLQNLRETVLEVSELFKQKLKRVFKLHSSLILRVDQISAALPIARLNQTVLFSQRNRDQLDREGERLEKEYNVRFNQNRQLFKSMKWLGDEMFMLEDALRRSHDELEKNFQLKFGERIDLSILDTLKETTKMKDLRREYKSEERAAAEQIRVAQESLAQCKREMMKLKRKNTEIIQRLTNLGKIQLKLNKILDSTNKQIFKDEQGTEKENLTRFQTDHHILVESHQKKLEQLRKEVDELKRKGNIPLIRKTLAGPKKPLGFKFTRHKKVRQVKNVYGVKLPKIPESLKKSKIKIVKKDK